MRVGVVLGLSPSPSKAVPDDEVWLSMLGQAAQGTVSMAWYLLLDCRCPLKAICIKILWVDYPVCRLHQRFRQGIGHLHTTSDEAACIGLPHDALVAQNCLCLSSVGRRWHGR